jgi:hypothetical protein
MWRWPLVGVLMGWNCAVCASDVIPADTSLPLNQWESLQVLADQNVSTIELPKKRLDGDPLFGADLNNNGVRDDYERYLLSHYQDSEWVAMGLLAANLWQQSLQMNTSKKDRKKLLQDSLLLEDCFYRLQQETQLTSPMLAYFNTPLRRAEKRKNRLMWLKSVKPTDLRLSSQSCGVFQSLYDRSQFHSVKPI